MASTFKTFTSDDIANTRTLLHEAIPITGSIVNGVTYTGNNNVKLYGHKMFQSVYDYPATSSSANHIFDIAHGSHADAQRVDNSVAMATTHPYYNKRKNLYNQMAQVLVGHDVNGEIRKFDTDGDLTGGAKHQSLLFFNFARLLGKDEIKKGTFSMSIGITPGYDATVTNMHTILADIKDTGAATDYRVNSPAGEYGILKITDNSGSGDNVTTESGSCGLIFYQAGIAAISTKVFMEVGSGTINNVGFLGTHSDFIDDSGGKDIETTIAEPSLTPDDVANEVRKRISNISFSNTTELNSTIYFCRVGHNDFNYSSNPTYLENSKVRVKSKSTDSPVSYITTVGLYSADNEMLAVAKLSEPLRKDPTNDMTLRVRLDY
jgi:hypothetical protein